MDKAAPFSNVSFLELIWVSIRTQKEPEVLANRYADKPAPYKLGGVLAAAAQGAACFNCDYYRKHNTDLPASFDCSAMFDHYVNHGQFEGREIGRASAFTHTSRSSLHSLSPSS